MINKGILRHIQKSFLFYLISEANNIFLLEAYPLNTLYIGNKLYKEREAIFDVFVDIRSQYSHYSQIHKFRMAIKL